VPPCVHGPRLPRTLFGLLAGLALGLAGAVFQSVTRNPLGSPDVLGITGVLGGGYLVCLRTSTSRTRSRCSTCEPGCTARGAPWWPCCTT
jgi:iron complex transport system permease protein